MFVNWKFLLLSNSTSIHLQGVTPPTSLAAHNSILSAPKCAALIADVDVKHAISSLGRRDSQEAISRASLTYLPKWDTESENHVEGFGAFLQVDSISDCVWDGRARLSSGLIEKFWFVDSNVNGGGAVEGGVCVEGKRESCAAWTCRFEGWI